MRSGKTNSRGLHAAFALILLIKRRVTGGNSNRTPKVTPEMSGCPDPRRSLATIVCRPIRVRYTCFSGVLTRMPSLSDRYRPSPNIANWWARSDSNRGPRDSLLPRRFRREWTISSPQWGAGRSSLSLSAAIRAQVVSAPSGGVPPAWLRVAIGIAPLRFP